ncbi:hypothetical protein BDR04DRAFT_1147384 [Suillus decipiens]|nr:hypothetical protein BDR04DRAFT_1147384 [Suillus decipiens]
MRRISHSPQFFVGPIIGTPFYRALDGVARVPHAPISKNVNTNRGPFSTVTEYLSSNLRAELEFISNHNSVVVSELYECGPAQSAESRLELGERVMRKAIDLCSIYPGNALIPANLTTPKKDHFLDINTDSGRVTGFIDFEAATIAPLWEYAVIPRWLQHTDDPESNYQGETSEERNILRTTFISAMEGLPDTQSRERLMIWAVLSVGLQIPCASRSTSGLLTIRIYGWTNVSNGPKPIPGLGCPKQTDNRLAPRWTGARAVCYVRSSLTTQWETERIFESPPWCIPAGVYIYIHATVPLVRGTLPSH